MKMKTAYQILWDAAKAVLKGKLIAISAYIKKLERSQKTTWLYTPKELQKEQEQIKSKVSRKKEIVSIRIEIDKRVTRKNSTKGHWNWELVLW